MPRRRNRHLISPPRSIRSARIASPRPQRFERFGLDLRQPAQSPQQKEAAAADGGAADDHYREADTAGDGPYRHRSRQRIGLADRVIGGRFHKEINRPSIG